MNTLPSLISFVLVVACFYFLIETSKKRELIAVAGVCALTFFWMSMLFLMHAPNGQPLSELNTKWTYVTMAVVNVDDTTVNVKLRRSDSSQSFCYELQKDRIVFWDGNEESFPEKFRVATDDKKEVYALISVK